MISQYEGIMGISMVIHFGTIIANKLDEDFQSHRTYFYEIELNEFYEK